MSTDAIPKPATSKQLAYIKRLQEEIGVDQELRDEIRSVQASEIISGLIVKGLQNGTSHSPVKINEPRLGMAMKECFRVWTGLGRDIWDEKRKGFIEEAILTYNLFTEIADKLRQNGRG